MNLDGNRATRQSLANLRGIDARWESVKVRENRYINNRIEQDHRAIKQRCASMLGHKSFTSAATTLAGIELAHRIRKGQFKIRRDVYGKGQSLNKYWEAALHGRPDELPAPGRNPPMHQNSISPLSTHRIRYRARPLRRFAVTVLLGQSLYLVAKPNGRRF